MTLIYFIEVVMKIPIVKLQLVLSAGKCLGYVSFYPGSQKKNPDQKGHCFLQSYLMWVESVLCVDFVCISKTLRAYRVFWNWVAIWSELNFLFFE
jgi:hypothetical protein